jgi:hypothetical protein
MLCALLTLAAGAPVPGAPTETVIKFTVQPMVESKPVLKYQLLPELREMNPGNPMYGYLKCFMGQNRFYHHKESVEKREKYQTMPLAELPLKELQDYGGWSLRQADWAARLDAPDWQILLQAKRDGAYLLLPDLQEMRWLAGALMVRCRVEAAEKRFPDALRTAKTIFAMSRHLGDHPTLIGNLVGIAVAMIGIGPVEEMVSQPGCPNLYSALTNLPDPFINLQKGARGETLFIDADLAPLTDKAPMGEADLKKVVTKVRELTAMANEKTPPKNVDRWLEERLKDEKHLEAARKRLVESGCPEERVKRFSPLQVLLLDEKLTYEEERDRASRWMGLPYWEIESKKLLAPAKGREDTLFGEIVAAYAHLKRAQSRLLQRLAMLRHVEGIRLHAAETGRLPEKLADVKVPLPVDPMTGKPFAYSVEGGKATLRGTPPRGQENAAGFNVRYEITLRK